MTARLIERLAHVWRETLSARITNQTPPCLECRTTHYDHTSEGVFLQLSSPSSTTSVVAHYCPACAALAADRGARKTPITETITSTATLSRDWFALTPEQRWCHDLPCLNCQDPASWSDPEALRVWLGSLFCGELCRPCSAELLCLTSASMRVTVLGLPPLTWIPHT